MRVDSNGFVSIPLPAVSAGIDGYKGTLRPYTTRVRNPLLSIAETPVIPAVPASTSKPITAAELTAWGIPSFNEVMSGISASANSPNSGIMMAGVSPTPITPAAQSFIPGLPEMPNLRGMLNFSNTPAESLNWPGYTATTPTTQIPGTSLNLPDIGEALRARAMEKPGIFDGLGKTWNSLSGFEKIGSVLGTANAVFNGYNAYKQNKIARDTLNFQKDQYAKQYEAQRKMTNSQLEDRQRSRVWTNPNQTSVHDYMQKYGV